MKKIQIVSVLLLLICTKPILTFSQRNVEHSILLSGGLYNQFIHKRLITEGEMRNFLCNQIGYNVSLRRNHVSGYNFGIKFIQNRYKRIINNNYYYSIITHAYLSFPIMLTLKLDISTNEKLSYYIRSGICIDYFLYVYKNSLTVNHSDYLFIRANEWFYLNYPISIHFETEFGTQLQLQKTKFSLSIIFQLFEIASFYGRNIYADDQWNMKYYYPFSVSVGLSYFMNKDKKHSLPNI